MEYKPYNLMEELKILKKSLNEQKNNQGSQAVSQAMVRIENLTFDLEMYKNALGLNKR